MVHDWNKDFVRQLARRRPVRGASRRRSSGRCAFMAACGVDDHNLHSVEFYASHEALLIDYERAMLRLDVRDPERPASSTTCPRTSCGSGSAPASSTAPTSPSPSCSPTRSGSRSARRRRPELAVEYVERLDPRREPGRLTLVSRMGNGKVRDVLPAHRGEGRGVRAQGHLAVRPDARQHPRVHHRVQDPPLRPHRRRGAGLLRGARRAGHAPGRHPRRGDRRGRHRVPRAARRRSPTPTSPAATRPPATRG